MIRRRHVAAAMSAFLLASCATNHATGNKVFSLYGQDTLRQMGQQGANQELEKYGLYKPDSKVAKYVTGLCRDTFAITEEAQQALSCLFVDDDNFNAWATPGYINVYRGLLPYMESEADLVAVLAHESGHINAHHAARGMTQHAVAGALVSALGIYVASQSDSSGLTNAALMGGSVAAGVTLASYSRGEELEADALGQRYMERMGYDRREAVSMLKGMGVAKTYFMQRAVAYNGGKPVQQGMLENLMSSHPATPERVAEALKIAGAEPDGSVRLPAGIKPATTADDPQGRKRFLNAIDGMAFGPGMRHGVAGRGYVAMPKHRLVWKLPDGFITDMTVLDAKGKTAAWRGVHPQTGVTFKSVVLKYKAGMNVGFALQEIFPSIDPDSIQRFKIGDGSHESYTLAGKQRGEDEAARVVAVALPEVNRMAIISFVAPDVATLAREEGTIMSELQKSTFLSEEKAKKIQPLKLKVFTAATGDTVARVAEKIPDGAMREELFRALNRLEPTDQLKVGQRYKTVVDANNL